MTSARRTGNRRRERTVEALRHEDDTRTNIPTAEYQSMVREEQESPLQKSYERRNRDLDPQLVWRGKDEQDTSDLVVNVPPLYIQEKVHPKSLIACAFNYDAHTTEFESLGRVPVLKARMNADLHMAGELKNTGNGNLFVIFGEPDIDILDAEDDLIQVRVNGVDVFHPNTGEVRSDGPDGIACWFIDTDYNQESFFVRHAYFLGASDPYRSLKTTLKAEIDADAWATLHSDTSRPFPKPETGRIAVKVINHLGDEVMKVFRVE